ncbi:hypothetical protein GCM10023213_28700 [Prosthecobacter algae]|uniref:Uncharacterized protein n=1 Tax=Prosthecobacter algae TaxID=1144682 RepID=A0ABP9PF17_9BACT
MINLHPIIYGTVCETALEAKQRLQDWLDEPTPRQRALLQNVFHQPTAKPKPLSRKVQAEIELLTGFSPAKQDAMERPGWGLVIKVSSSS